MAISPKEQTEVMERIFGTDTAYSEATQKELRQVMFVAEQNYPDISIYGKTGMGRSNGIIDAWFTGFAEHMEGRVYFCVYLGKTDDERISSTVAKGVAIRLVSDYFKN